MQNKLLKCQLSKHLKQVNCCLLKKCQKHIQIDTIQYSFFRRIHELKLLRHRNPNLFLSWTIMHPIDADSPLYGMTAADLAEKIATISVLITGVDETVAYAINARHSYDAKEILLDRQFEDIILRSENGDRYFDYSRFHHIKP